MIERADALAEAALKEGLAKTGLFWNLALDDLSALAGVKPMGKEELRERLAREELVHDFLYGPSEIEMGSEMFLVPIVRAGWEPLEVLLAAYRPRVIIASFPYHLNVDSLITLSSVKCSLPTVFLMPHNRSAITHIDRELEIEGMVTHLGEARALHNLLEKEGRGRSVRFWYLACAPDDRETFKPTFGVSCRGLHLFPGLPVAFQCPSFGEQGAEKYHPLPSFVWEQAAGDIFITTIVDSPMPLLRFRVCTGSLTRESCLCGRDLTLTLAPHA